MLGEGLGVDEENAPVGSLRAGLRETTFPGTVPGGVEENGFSEGEGESTGGLGETALSGRAGF